MRYSVLSVGFFVFILAMSQTSRAQFEKPITSLQLGKFPDFPVKIPVGEVPQIDMDSYWLLEGDLGLSQNWLKMAHTPDNRYFVFYSGKNPRLYKKLGVYEKHNVSDDFSGLVAQLERTDFPKAPRNSIFNGLISVYDQLVGEAKNCPNSFWWMPIELKLGTEYLHDFVGKVETKTIVRDQNGNCTLGQAKEVPVRLVRHKGVRLAPFPDGKFITFSRLGRKTHSTVQIEWDYQDLEEVTEGIGRVVLRIGRTYRPDDNSTLPEKELLQSTDNHGSYTHTWEGDPSKHYVFIDVFDKNDLKLFSDIILLRLGRGR